jgi:flavin prenyltransferase
VIDKTLPEMQILSPKRIILAITGASGAVLGIRALEFLKEAHIETHLVISHAARQTIKLETNRDLDEVIGLADFYYDPDDLGAAIASGSFTTHGMLVIPCSIKTLSAIANSFADNLIMRAADVCLKEGRPLLLAVRETPYHRGHLRLMDLAARMGAVIFPPVPAFYGHPASLDDIIDNLVSRMLMRIGIDTGKHTVWKERY